MLDTPSRRAFWPFRPQPVSDESFSSWFCRTAWQNGLNPADLYRIGLPGARMHRIDLDRFACDELIETLAHYTDMDADDLRHRTFDAWNGRLIEDGATVEKLLWLPPAGTDRTCKSFGQQVCPDCLREQATPYLKRHWRLAFVTGCTRHHKLLIDRCPECSAPIQPLFTSMHVDSVATCWKCGFDLRKTPQTPVTHYSDLAIQKDLLETAEDGWTYMGEYGAVYSLSYFRILWIVYRLLATGQFAMPLREWTSEYLKETVPPTNIPRIKEIELLNPRCRQTLLRYAHYIMQNWPHNFIAACRVVEISARNLIKGYGQEPFALWDPVRRHLNTPPAEIEAEVINAAKRQLKSQNITPTYRELTNLIGVKFQAKSHMAEPGRECAPYGTHRYWKLDGVSAEIRAAAKTAARREGENVGPWVDKVLRSALRQK
ncbi:MAG: TniQ family protein [Rhodospirillales bacterium]|nr:TniQ family protein [Rhodospirillales bacterium]